MYDIEVERKGARIGRNGYRKIASTLQDRIEGSQFESGAFLPTERELQEEFGAARSTIRKALAELIDRGWAQNVPNKGVVVGRGLRPAANGRIALVESGTFVQQVLGARFESMLHSQGRQLVSVGGSAAYPFEYALQRVLDEEFAGAIVWCFEGFPDPELVSRLARHIPVVALDHRLGSADTDLVAFDHEGAAYAATEALIRQGAKRIGVTGMLDMLDITHARFRGYMHAMFVNGLQPDPCDYVFCATSGCENSDLLEARLRGASRPEALLVLQDIFMPHVVESALRAGLSLPNDLRLATIGDDIDISVDGIGMTAVAFDWEALATEAFHLLVERLDDLHRSPQARLIPHRLVVRGLCGAPSSQWTSEPQTVTGFQGELPVPRSSFDYSSGWRCQRRP
jgi:LacI family transcriptional regulator